MSGHPYGKSRNYCITYDARVMHQNTLKSEHLDQANGQIERQLQFCHPWYLEISNGCVADESATGGLRNGSNVVQCLLVFWGSKTAANLW